MASMLFKVARLSECGNWIDQFLVEVASQSAREARAALEYSLQRDERIVGWFPRLVSTSDRT